MSYKSQLDFNNLETLDILTDVFNEEGISSIIMEMKHEMELSDIKNNINKLKFLSDKSRIVCGCVNDNFEQEDEKLYYYGLINDQEFENMVTNSCKIYITRSIYEFEDRVINRIMLGLDYDQFQENILLDFNKFTKRSIQNSLFRNICNYINLLGYTKIIDNTITFKCNCKYEDEDMLDIKYEVVE
jgi:hypothetical protein